MRVAGEEWHGCGWRGRVGGRYIGDGSEAVSHLCEDWNGLQGRGLYIDLVLADGEAQAEVDLPFCRKVGLAHGDRVDMPDGTVAPLDRAQRDDQRVDELLEVVLEEGQVHEVVLHHVGVGFVLGTYKTRMVFCEAENVGWLYGIGSNGSRILASATAHERSRAI